MTALRFLPPILASFFTIYFIVQLLRSEPMDTDRGLSMFFGALACIAFLGGWALGAML